MVRKLAAVLLLLLLAVPGSAQQQGTNVNAPPGSVWTYLGSTFGAAWAPPRAVPGVFDVQLYGAVGNGVANDSAAFMAAAQACGAAGGGWVVVRPTGRAYRLAVGLGNGVSNAAWPAGCPLVAIGGGLNWPNPVNVYNNNEIQWTDHGVWLRCEDMTYPCITMNTPGNGVMGFNFWYTQPTPTSTTHCGTPCTYTYGWTPTAYPYTMRFGGNNNFFRIEHNNIVNANNCIDIQGSGISGIYSYIENNSFGCAGTGIRANKVDNTIVFRGNRHEMWWFQGSSDWWGWLQGTGNHVDMDIRYLANPIFDSVEFAFTGLAMKFTDDCVTSGFGTLCFAVAYINATNVSFNEVCQAMVVAAPDTRVTGSMSNVIIAVDTTTSPVAGQCANKTGATNLGNFMLQLNSDNVNLYITGLQGTFAQGLGYIGGGSAGEIHGQLHVRQLGEVNYSAFQSGTPLFMTDATGSVVDVAGLNWVFGSKTFTPGVKCSGACMMADPHLNTASLLQSSFATPGVVCNSSTVGSMVMVTDLLALPTYRSAVTSASGGGTYKSLVMCDSDAWRTH